MKVEWYAANPCFHPIPPGYGLPWGTPEEEYIPAPLVFEAEMALAREQLATQTPPYKKFTSQEQFPMPLDTIPGNEEVPPDDWPESDWDENVQSSQYVEEVELAGEDTAQIASSCDPLSAGMPPNWPDPRGFIPPPPCATPPNCQPSVRPVISHTRIYDGADMEFTEALASYYYFRDEARFGGWQAYLQRSDDFIGFCCHMHISETLSARGGVGETRVVWRWPTIR